MTSILSELLKDTAYRLDQFTAAQISQLESTITLRDSTKKPTPYVTCLVRGKPIKLTAEEAVRQLTDQATYETAVQQMVTHRQRATRPLDAAKRAVEIAIEDSEAAALAHLAAANPPEAAA